MKRSVLLFSIICACLQHAPMLQTAWSQQTEFVIGADWLRQPPIPYYEGQTLITEVPLDWWERVSAAGIRWVSIYTDTLYRNLMVQELGHANTAGMLTVPGHSEGMNAYFTRGNRWRYHPEYNGHFTYDTLRKGELWSEVGAEKDADAFSQPLNSVRARVNIDTVGYLCHGLIPQDLNNAGHLHVRLRLRLPDAPLDTSIQVLRVFVDTGGVTMIDAVITGGHLKRTPTTAQSEWRGVPLASNDAYGEVLVGDFVRDGIGSVDIRVQWLGNVSVILDYVAFDDDAADELFGGTWDHIIDHEIDTLMSTQWSFPNRIARFKSADEPTRYKWPLVGYHEERVAQRTGNQKHTLGICSSIASKTESTSSHRVLMHAKPFHSCN